MRGWFREPHRHSLAARGYKMNLRLTDNETIKKLRTSSIEQALTPEMENILLSANDPAELNELMLRHEKEMAEKRNEYFGENFYCEYLVCDEAVEIMSYVLKRKGITHEIMMGFGDTGDTHVWIRVDEINYDPTEQGMHEGQLVESWNPITGNKIHDYKDPDLDEKEYWDNIDVMDSEEENRRLEK